MKATDLRIGNLIQVGGNTLETYQTYKPIVVTLDILRDIAEENKERPDAILSVFQPIKLTEDWLLLFGFTPYKLETDFMSWGIDGKFDFVIGNDGGLDEYNNYPMYFIGENYIVEIKYVHHLQNLFYSLSGNELTLTTPTP